MESIAMSSMTDQEVLNQHHRSEYIAGLRAMADMLEKHLEVPLPYAAGTGGDFFSDRMVFFCESKDEIAAFAHAFPAKLDKRVDESSQIYGFELLGSVHGLHVVAAVHRDEVCERVVTGTREVTKSVPDPTIVVPLVEVTETVEDVEWVCRPLLAEATS